MKRHFTYHNGISKLWIPLAVLLMLANYTACQSEEKTAEAAASSDTDPLPSWNEGPLKTAIIRYVTAASTEGDPGFVPETDRIATFDNDGTLWAEKPLVQELFAFYMVKKMAAENPGLATVQPYKAVLENDKSYFVTGGEKAILQLVELTHTGTTEDEFEQAALVFFGKAQYPGYDRPIRQILYQPQLELLAFLQAKGFKVFLCSGGTVEFMRAISLPYYNIPKERVIGTAFTYEFDDSSGTILRKPALLLFNDQAMKPAAIQLHIGQRPVFACGNEGGHGDIAMLKYSQASKYPSFQLLVNHDDSLREFYYQEKDNLSLNTAAERNWHVISMKNDWKTVFVGK